jgi:hypothetical protein
LPALVEVSVASFEIDSQLLPSVIFAQSQMRMISHPSVEIKLSLEKLCTFRNLNGPIIDFANLIQDIVFVHRNPFQLSEERLRLGHSLTYSLFGLQLLLTSLGNRFSLKTNLFMLQLIFSAATRSFKLLNLPIESSFDQITVRYSFELIVTQAFGQLDFWLLTHTIFFN